MDYTDEYDLQTNRDVFDAHLQHVNVDSANLEGTLFVAGLSECGVEFHLGTLLTLSNDPCQPVWPDTQRYLFAFQDGRTDNKDGRLNDLARVVQRNAFQMVVIVNLVFGKNFVKHKRLANSLKNAVDVRGATLVLFCCESVDAIHGDLFNRTWRQAQYTRTTTTQTAAAMRMLPDAEDSVNAKAIFLSDVPPNEQWYTMTDRSKNDNLIPSIHSAPTCGYASVAAGFSGRGRIVYISDVNAEPETCSILVSLAQSIFPDSHISGSDSDNSGVPCRDKARAEQHKAKGNAAYEAGSMQDAIASYTSAIEADHTNHVYFSNRALAHLKVKDFVAAKDDCDNALGICWSVKALLRRGNAWLGLQDFTKACKDFEQAVQMEPNNRDAQQHIKMVAAHRQQLDC